MTTTISPKTGLSALLAAVALAVAAPALAASPDEEKSDKDADKEAGGDEAGTDGTDGAEAGAEADKPAASTSEPPAAPAAPVEETVFVVQGKPFLARGKFEVAPQITQSVNDSFTSHTGLIVSGLYHLKENVALEVAAGGFAWADSTGFHLGGRDSELTVELREKEALAPERVKLYQFPYFVAADAQWSPMYGKVSMQDLVLGQFNLYLSVGAGVFGLQLESVTQNGITKSYAELPATFGFLPSLALSTSFGAGLRFYFTDWLGVRFEVRDYVIPLSVRQTDVEDADSSSFDVTNLVLGQLGVSFLF